MNNKFFTYALFVASLISLHISAIDSNDPFFKVLSLPTTARNLPELDTYKASLTAKLLLESAEVISPEALQVAKNNQYKLPKVYNVVVLGHQMNLAITSNKESLAKIKAQELIKYIPQEEQNRLQEWYDARG